jgi:membrane protein DedA with SNARE-associated domain
MDRWRRWQTWAWALLFIGFVMGSASSGAQHGQRELVAGMAMVALLALLLVVGARWVARRVG